MWARRRRDQTAHAAIDLVPRKGVHVSDSACAGAGIAGAARRVLGRLPGVPRRHHRQRCLPLDQGVVPRHVDRRVVLGPQCLQHRLRRLPHRLRPAHRPVGPTARIRLRGGALHRRLGPVRRRPVRGAAGRCPRVASAWGGPARAGFPGPRRRGVPRGAPRARCRSVGSQRRRRRGPRASAGRSAGAAGRLALGLPGQPALRDRGPLGGTQPAGREPGTGSSYGTGPAGSGSARRLPECPQPRHHQGHRLGLDECLGDRGVPRDGAAAGPLRAQLTRPPITTPGPGADADPVLPHRRSCDRARRSGVLRLSADQHPVAAVRLGVRRAAGRSRTGARRAGGRSRRSTTGTAGRSSRLPRLRGARRPGVGGRLPLVPRAGGPASCVLVGVAPGAGAQRYRGRRDTAAAGERRARRCSRRSLCHRIGRRVERAPAGRGAGHRGAGRDPGRPHYCHGGCCLPRRLVALHRGVRARRPDRPPAGSSPVGH